MAVSTLRACLHHTSLVVTAPRREEVGPRREAGLLVSHRPPILICLNGPSVVYPQTASNWYAWTQQLLSSPNVLLQTDICVVVCAVDSLQGCYPVRQRTCRRWSTCAVYLYAIPTHMLINFTLFCFVACTSIICCIKSRMYNIILIKLRWTYRWIGSSKFL